MEHVRITIVLAIRMANVFIKEVINLRTVLLFMVKLVGNKKPSLLIVPLLAAMQIFAVNVKGKIFFMKVATSRSGFPFAM